MCEPQGLPGYQPCALSTAYAIAYEQDPGFSLLASFLRYLCCGSESACDFYGGSLPKHSMKPSSPALEPKLTSANANSGCAWFALQVRSRYEKNVANFLDGKGYEWFLPSYRSRRRWSDRVKEVELPLFPGYLFCRFDPQERLPILKTPGMIAIVGTAKVPTAVDETEIAALRTLVASGLPRQPWPYLQIGQRVRIEHGALFGLEGILIQQKGFDRLVLSVTLLQRSVAAEIDSSWVVPIHSRPQMRPPAKLGRPVANLQGA
jgi:transcription antitermination factor NusG